jgi:hypothetical protein
MDRMPEEDAWVQRMGKGYQKSEIRYQEADGGGLKLRRDPSTAACGKRRPSLRMTNVW